MEENGLNILNGKTKEDWEGECIYGTRGCTVIDYAFASENVLAKILEFKIEERVDSDHLSIIVKLETEEVERERNKGNRRKKENYQEKEIILG